MTSERRTAVILLAILAGLLTIGGIVAIGYATQDCLRPSEIECITTGIGMVDRHPYTTHGAILMALAVFAGLGSLIVYLSRPRDSD